MIMICTFVFSSCEENAGVEFDGSQTLLNFDSSTGDLSILVGDVGSLDVGISVTTSSESARTFILTVDTENSTAAAASYSVPESVTIAAGEYNGSFTIDGVDVDGNLDPKTLIIDFGSSDAITDGSLTVSVFVVCPFESAQMEGDWVLDMQDSYGDGWNGASVTFEVDGVGTDYDLDTYTGDGATATTTITVPSGTTSLKFYFSSGAWDSEITFQVTAPNDVEVGSYGPSPTPGEFEVDYCLL